MATAKELQKQVDELTAQVEALTAENEQLKTPLEGVSVADDKLRMDLFLAMAGNIRTPHAKTDAENLLKAVDEVIKVLGK